MNIAINLSTLKKGGGQNVAQNFLNVFLTQNVSDDRVFYIVAKDSPLHRRLKETIVEKMIITVPQNPIKRIICEIFQVSSILKKLDISVIYSYFGYGFYPSSIPQIVGSADSNLYYPEVDFWSQYSGIKLLFKKLIDRYRIWGLKRASGIIFETSVLEKRCIEIYKFKALTITIKPSISIPKANLDFEMPYEYIGKSKGLLLCSWQLNKNIMIIPEICSVLKSRKQDFLFIITAPKDGSKIYQEFIKKVRQYNVEQYIYISGTVPKEKLVSLYSQVDIVFLLSKLESFSNNIIEAWAYNKPLVVSDEDWAHDICGDGALYVNRDDPNDISFNITNLLTDINLYNQIIYEGVKKLNEYPPIEERTKQELNFIKKVYETNV